MPTAWPKGKSAAARRSSTARRATQIEAIWVYLRDGTKAQLPVGMGKQSIPLIPTSEAIIYRNFIEGAGTRAIGVGYPEKVNLAFDANELRLAMIWQGRVHRRRRATGPTAASASRGRWATTSCACRRGRASPCWPRPRTPGRRSRPKELGYRVPRLPPDAGRPADVPVRGRRRARSRTSRTPVVGKERRRCGAR